MNPIGEEGLEGADGDMVPGRHVDINESSKSSSDQVSELRGS